MGFGMRIRTLWRLRAGVLVSATIALLAALLSTYKLPSLEPRSLEMASAATHVVVDTPKSILLDLRESAASLEGLTARTVLLGNVMATEPVRSRIAQRAGVAPEALVIDAPLTPRQPRPRVEAGKQKKTTDLFESTDQYRIKIEANPTVPVLDVYAQTPDVDSAALLANAAVDELARYLAARGTAEHTPAKDQIRLVQLGRAEGIVVNEGVRWQLAVAVFLFTFALLCGTVLFVARAVEGWKLAARAEGAPGAA